MECVIIRGMAASPIPAPDITKISTSSLFFLKYCPTMMEAVPFVRLTPEPMMRP